MADWWVSSVAWTAMTAWAASTAYTVGNLRRQLAAPTSGNERAFRCTTAGTSGGTEPAWTITKGGTTNDGTAVWTEVTGNNAYNTPTALSAPFARVDQAVALTWMASGGGDRLLVASNHVQNPTSTSVGMSFVLPGTNTSPSSMISFDQTNATLTYLAGMQFNIAAGGTAGRNVAISGPGVFAGGSVTNAVSGGTSYIASSGNYGLLVQDWNMYSTASDSSFHSVGVSSGTASNLFLRGVNFRGGATGSTVSLLGNVDWEGGTIFDSGTVASPAIGTYGYTCRATIRGINASSVNTGKTLFNPTTSIHSVNISDSSIGSGATILSASANTIGLEVNMTRVDSGATTYRNERYFGGSSFVTETALIATAGASNGVTGYSWKIATGSAVTQSLPFGCFPITAYNTTTGSAKSATIEGIWSSTVVPKNNEIWMALGYEGSASTPVATFATSLQTNLLATGANLTASTVAWDSLITARANSTAYSLGDMRKVASNSGRVFICTTAGTSSGSEPGGYASAVDGGSVTDNTAVFRAMVRFKIQIASFTPQMAGYLYAMVRTGRASSTLYVSPKLTIA